jgi:hypothetical protein
MQFRVIHLLAITFAVASFSAIGHHYGLRGVSLLFCGLFVALNGWPLLVLFIRRLCCPAQDKQCEDNG